MTTTPTTLPTFATMDEYKTWRAAWRAEYAQLTLDIRAAKLKLRVTNREYSTAVGFVLCSTMNKARSHAEQLSNRATEAIDTRHISKVRSAELYAATHTEAA